MEPFKSAISSGLIQLRGRLLAREAPGADPEDFAAPLIAQLEDLELKQRVALVAEALHAEIPSNPDTRRSMIMHADDMARWNVDSTEEGLWGWSIWPLAIVISNHGLGSTEWALETSQIRRIVRQT